MTDSKKSLLKFGPDINVFVPESLDLISYYVLREQGDWFEDEIKFVRRLLQAGEQAIDIGANYGLFSLSIAKTVGPEGKVWSFEPATTTAAFLGESIASNAYENITLDRRGLSDHDGVARLTLNSNSELNEVVRDDSATGPSETISLVSLDTAMAEYGWKDIDFLKIDAEGEEAAIIRGGRRFFQELSPLVQYEVKAGAEVHLELVRHFEDIGYSSYRLVPGLDFLVPFEPQGLVDGYLLNLFCCKPDRARTLGQMHRLVQHEELKQLPQGNELLARLNVGNRYGWRKVLSRHAYGKLMAPTWQNLPQGGLSDDVERALALHAIAHDQALSAADRYAALKASMETLVAVCNQQPAFLRTLSLARVAREFGARSLAVQALNLLVNQLVSRNEINIAEPFLAASPYFDTLNPGDAIGNWVICSALEELERNSAFSSIYSGASALERLLPIRQLGFGSPEMARRLELVQQRFPDAVQQR